MAEASRMRRKAERRGRRSETIRRRFLMLKGYRILGRRVRTHAGEIDLIARAPSGLICFIEVKARGDARRGRSRWRRASRRASRAPPSFIWPQRPGSCAPRGVRFDIVAVAPGSAAAPFS